MLEIEPLNPALVDAIVQRDGGNGWKNDPTGWVNILSQHNAGARLVLVASEAGAPVGYGSLVWRSGYPPFADAGTPELHDLVTARSHRHQGVGTTLIASLAKSARNRGHTTIGLGVGLYADYGPAQRLYAALGYQPDGRGLTYQNGPVPPGATIRADDDLILWMVKNLA
ncbi:GNAT family N-acetyltransferase [Devosia sp.]|uniref:GNAT family N-acetyltransferase n=1 Tax=Devosia sp. TaxID=1871048 RepID=UPI001ACFDEA9|nr:GNAT family N-acetyltransferase [Devosia sp.]MBN9334594.1 GNAT family N-acetyltransferase [Devosia sp.]